MSAPPQLTAERLDEVLGFLRGADTAELKLTVPETRQYETVRALGVDPLDARMGQIFFLDTPELTLNAAGVAVVRPEHVAKCKIGAFSDVDVLRCKCGRYPR